MSPPRHSCSVEYWRSCKDEDDEHDDEGHGGRSLTPQRCSLFQWLHWPVDKRRSRERSPRCGQGESSRHCGRWHGRATSSSPGGRRSREHSLDRTLHRFKQLQPRQDSGCSDKPPCCRPWVPGPDDNPDSGVIGAMAVHKPKSATDSTEVNFPSGPPVISVKG
jgi:hypothetical protein